MGIERGPMTASTQPKNRILGSSDLSVVPIGLGCMSLSGAYGKSNDDEAIRVIHHALDRGVNFLDSSDMYGWGHNETLIGKALAGGRRGKVVLATKFGQTQQPGGANGVDGSPAHVKAACDASLKRLGVDVIDLYYQHRVDPSVPIEDTVGAMAELVKAGKVRALGLSYVAYSPLGRSLLTGTVKQASDIPEGDGRGRHPRFAAANLEQNVSKVAAIEALAREKGCKPGQVALAWLLAQGPDIVPIPGTKRAERVDENLAALGVTLSADEVARLSSALPPGAAAGTRYPEGGMKGVYL